VAPAEKSSIKGLGRLETPFKHLISANMLALTQGAPRIRENYKFSSPALVSQNRIADGTFSAACDSKRVLQATSQLELWFVAIVATNPAL